MGLRLLFLLLLPVRIPWQSLSQEETQDRGMCRGSALLTGMPAGTLFQRENKKFGAAGRKAVVPVKDTRQSDPRSSK